MPSSTEDSRPAYNTQFLGHASEAILEQYCAWLSEPFVPLQKAKPEYSTSSDWLVDQAGDDSGALRLDDRSYITKAPSSLTDPSLGPSDHDVLCLLMRKLDYDIFVGSVTHVYVTHLTKSGEPLPYGIKITRWRGAWSAEPEMLDPSFFPFLQSIRVKSNWLISLLKVNKSVLNPLFVFGRKTCRDVRNEVEVLVNHFRLIGPHSFFETATQEFAWECALRWFDWEASGIRETDRIDQLAAAVGEQCSAEVYESIRPSVMASTSVSKLLQGPPCAEGKRSVSGEALTDLPFTVQLRQEKSLFSKGGPYDLRFPQTLVSVEGSPPHDNWWWRGYLDGTWDKTLASLFSDNWEKSAFAYEMQARQIYPIRWFVFNRPWYKLTFVMRALLQAVLNVDLPGTQTLRPSVAQPLSVYDPDLMPYVADLRLSKTKIVEAFEAKLSAVQEPKEAAHKVQDFPKPNWKVLEWMDMNQLVNEHLDDSQRSAISKAKIATLEAWRHVRR